MQPVILDYNIRGQQQRVAIAQAVINSPEVILCDEPTGVLDSGTSEEMMKLFHELNGEGQHRK